MSGWKPIEVNIDDGVRDGFWANVAVGKADECWAWQGPLRADNGYGYFRLPGKTIGAHQLSVLVSGRKIPHGAHIDHLCRNPACVNPSHLEPVSSRENTLRGMGPTAINARKTHCNLGHPLAGDNVFSSARYGWRYCRTCHNRRKAEGRAKKKEAKNG